ncbi:hypothetical protein [Synechococcus sp. PCC 7336]|nr:hypothetical protein [Synechococcus sp. PCC 7336]
MPAIGGWEGTCQLKATGDPQAISIMTSGVLPPERRAFGGEGG